MNSLLKYLFESVQTEADVKKIKDKIIELGIQGKLLNKSSYSQDTSVEITEKWVVKTVEEVLTLKSGRSLSAETVFSKSKGVLYLKVGDMNLPNNKLYINDSSRRIENGYNEKDLIPANSIVFPKRGGAIATNKKKIVHKPLLADANIMAMIIPDTIDLEYVYLWFQTINLWNLNSGTSVPQINNKDINPLSLPLPPIEVQRQIVTKVNELLQICDDLSKQIKQKKDSSRILNKTVFTSFLSESSEEADQALQFAVSHMDELLETKEDIDWLRKGILALAMKGKLVPQDTNNESASVLLNRIEKEKQQLIKEKRITKKKDLLPIKEDEVPYKIPENWEWVKIGSVGLINPKNDGNDNQEVSFIPMKLVKDGIANSHTFETKKWKQIKKGYTHVAENDVVVAKITPCFQNRKSAVMKNLYNGYGAGTTEFLVFRQFKEDLLSSEYVLNLFKTEHFIQKGMEIFTGTAGQQRISKEYFENTLLPCPPIKEQYKIVNKVNELFKVCDKLEEHLNRRNENQTNLLNSIV